MAIFGNIFGQGQAPGPEQSTSVSAGNKEPEDTKETEDKGQENEEKTGLAFLEDLMQNTKKGEGENNPDTTPAKPFDPEEILQNQEAMDTILKGMDFQAAISKETQQKLADNAEDALPSMVQDIAKAAYSKALQHSVVLTKQYVQDTVANLVKEQQSTIQSSIRDSDLQREMPELANPVIQAGLQAIKQQIESQNPNMSPKDVAKQLRSYVQDVNALMNPIENKPKDTNTQDDTDDWEAFFNADFKQE